MAIKIRNRARAYNTKFDERILLQQICQFANSHFIDIPDLQVHNIADKQNSMCYACMLGLCCHGKTCTFNHIPGKDLPEAFVNNIYKVLTPGVDYLVRNGQQNNNVNIRPRY